MPDAVNVDLDEPVKYRDIPGFPGYRVGSDGSVWSSVFRSKGGKMVPGGPWKKFKPCPTDRSTPNNYFVVRVGMGAQNRRCTVHSLVLLTFVGPCPEGMECCHKDGNRQNNRLSNLRWDTRKANARDRGLHGTLMRGEACHAAKLTESQVLEIRRLATEGVRYRVIRKIFGVGRTTVAEVVQGKRWNHVPSIKKTA